MPRPKIFQNIWASSGDTGLIPNAAKKILGWVAGEKPEFELFNLLQNRTEVKINDIIQEGPGTWYPQATDVNAMITTGLWDDSWGVTSDTANVISGGATREYRDIKVYFDSNDNPRLLVLDNSNLKIEVWDPRTLSLILATNDLDDDLDTSGSQTWEVESFCTDGTDVYVTFVDTNASPETHQIQAWTIDEGTSNWSVKSGWGSTGTALQGTGLSAGNFMATNVINADSSNLAVINSYTNITASSDPLIQLILKSDGSAVRDGSGDATTGASLYGNGAIVSDGTYLYFTVSSASSRLLCSADISDLTTGSGGTNYPLGIGGATASQDCLISCGANMSVLGMGDSSATDTSILLRTLNSTDADLDSIQYGQSSQASPVDGEDYILEYPMAGCFDGTNAWIFGTNSPSGGNTAVLVKIDVAKLNLRDMATRQMPDLVSGVFVLDPDTDFPTGSANWIYQRCVFDGRDVWVNIEPRASQTNSGKLFRLPNVAIRG